MDLSQECFDKNVRIDNIIHIAGSLGDSSHGMSECLINFFEQRPEDLFKIFGKKFGQFFEGIEDIGEIETEQISDFALDFKMEGFLIEVSTPVYENITDNEASFSWGYSHCSWVYGETYDKALDKCFEWVADVREKEIQKTIKKDKEDK